ncbi:LysE family translocator [Marinoscillum pacificum]|uniref:LysE family translocator n=1 Tax=Marinoscillum pacificum TaxID=392723 RepID=UPI002158263E|nr:LysE family translocator [Marinoscillum pacificum]
MALQVFIVAFVVSYLGSIPPGTINITTMQLSVQGLKRPAFFFALAASLTEFVYAGVTVKFQIFLSERPGFTENFTLITAIAMIVLGVINLFAKTDTEKLINRTAEIKGRNGFKKGVLLGILNPLTIPFWLTVTAYLQANKWISLKEYHFWIYLTGLTIGTFLLLLTVNRLGRKFTNIASNQFLVHKVPGIAFLGLGLYNMYQWFSS